MHSKKQIAWNLIETKHFTRSKVAELLGLRLTEVHGLLKTKPKGETNIFKCEDCIHHYCPTPIVCGGDGCQHEQEEQ